MKVKLTAQDLRRQLVGDRPAYEKYVSPLINLVLLTASFRCWRVYATLWTASIERLCIAG